MVPVSNGYSAVIQQILADAWHQLLRRQQAPMQQHVGLAALRHALTCKGSFRQGVALDDHRSGAGCICRCSGEQAREAGTDDHYLTRPGASRGKAH